MNYVDILRQLREDNDLSQKKVGKVLNKSQQGYSHLENGVSRFTVDDIITLAKFYNVSADYILGLPEDMPYPKR